MIKKEFTHGRWFLAKSVTSKIFSHEIQARETHNCKYVVYEIETL